MEATTTPTSAEATREAAKRDFDALARRDPDGMKAAYADDAIIDFVPLGLVLRGNEELRHFFVGLFAAIPDLETTYEVAAAEGDTVAVEYRVRGTHSGAPFQGVEPTGKSVELRGVDVMHIENDLIARNT